MEKIKINTTKTNTMTTKVIEKHHFKYKSGQQYTINGNTITYCKMVKGRLLFKDSQGKKIYFTTTQIKNHE